MAWDDLPPLVSGAYGGAEDYTKVGQEAAEGGAGQSGVAGGALSKDGGFVTPNFVGMLSEEDAHKPLLEQQLNQLAKFKKEQMAKEKALALEAQKKEVTLPVDYMFHPVKDFVQMDLKKPEVLLFGGAVGAVTPHAEKVWHQSNKDDWGTPWDFFLWVDSQFHLTLDVCATAANTKCGQYLTPEMDGREVDWWGRVWMNPPYSQVGAWLEEMASACKTGEIELGVALVAARPDTQWWWDAAREATEIWFLKGRLTFEGATANAPFPSALLIFYPHTSPQAQSRSVRFVDWKAPPGSGPSVLYY